MTEKEKAKDKKIREAILNGLIDCRDAPDLGWSNFGGIHIDDCIAWLEKQGKSPWISVEDDLPCNHKELISTEYDKETIYVLVIGKDAIADTDCMEYNGKEWRWQRNSFFEPTHWMPIPKLPKE